MNGFPAQKKYTSFENNIPIMIGILQIIENIELTNHSLGNLDDQFVDFIAD